MQRIELRITVDALRQEIQSLRAAGEERLQTIHTQVSNSGVRRAIALCSNRFQFRNLLYRQQRTGGSVQLLLPKSTKSRR